VQQPGNRRAEQAVEVGIEPRGRNMRVGWHRLAEGKATSREWTRAGDVGKAPSERAVCLGDEATTYGGGSAAAEWRPARDAMDSRRGSREITGPTDRWRAAMRAVPSADSPGAAGLPVATGPATAASAVRSPACARAWVHTGFAARVGRSRSPGGRARARPGIGGVNVSGWFPGTTGV